VISLVDDPTSVRLLAISDTVRLDPAALLERTRQLCALARPRTVVVQLRDRKLSVRDRQLLGERLRECTRATGQWFQVNDRLDLALLLEADALHLGEGSVSPEEARRFFTEQGRPIWISRAWHDPRVNPEPGADAYVLSPIIEPRKGNPALGLDALDVARATLLGQIMAYAASEVGAATSDGAPPEPLTPRLFALGGVGAETAAACLERGAQGVAAIGSVFGDTHPAALLKILEILRGSLPPEAAAR
jgi:thiamine monophosphate synthase